MLRLESSPVPLLWLKEHYVHKMQVHTTYIIHHNTHIIYIIYIIHISNLYTIVYNLYALLISFTLYNDNTSIHYHVMDQFLTILLFVLLAFSLQLRGLSSHHSAQPTSDGLGEETPSTLTNNRPNSAKSSDFWLMILSLVSNLWMRKSPFFTSRTFEGSIIPPGKEMAIATPMYRFITAPLGARGHLLKILGVAIAIYFHQGFDTSSLFMWDVSRIRCTPWKHFGFQGSWWPVEETTNCGWVSALSLFGWYRLIKYLQFVGFYALWFSSRDSKF